MPHATHDRPNPKTNERAPSAMPNATQRPRKLQAVCAKSLLQRTTQLFLLRLTSSEKNLQRMEENNATRNT